MTQQEEKRRDSGVFVLVYRGADENEHTIERVTWKEIHDFIEQIGGDERVVAFYVGAKKRSLRKVVSYTF